MRRAEPPGEEAPVATERIAIVRADHGAGHAMGRPQPVTMPMS